MFNKMMCIEEFNVQLQITFMCAMVLLVNIYTVEQIYTCLHKECAQGIGKLLQDA